MDWYEAAREYHLRMPDDARLSSLPSEWRRELVALMLVNQEVNNGGYLQFLANHGREAYEYAVQALKAIGAHRMAGIIACCQALVDEHFLTEDPSSGGLRQLLPNKILGRDGGTIKEAGSVLPDGVLTRVSELSCDFMEYPDSVADLAQGHYGPLIEADGGPDKPAA